MFKALKKFVCGEEKPKVNDIFFSMMYFVDVEAGELMKSVKTEQDFINRILIPFNFIAIPFILGARCIKGKNGWALLFNEYSLSEKEVKQVLFLIDKFYDLSEDFYTSQASDTEDDIENIPAREVTLKKVKISEIPEILFGKNGNDGIIAQRINSDVAEKLIAEGKEIGENIRKKALLVEIGVGTLIAAALAGGGYYMYSRKDNESTEEVVTTDNSEGDITDVEPVEDIVVVSTDEM